MQKSPRKFRNGFEYHGESLLGDWVWHFRPVGGPIDVQGPRTRDEFRKLLDNAPLALQFYMAELEHRSDEVAARAELARQQKQASHVPPGKRDTRRKIEGALRKVAEAQRLTQLLADHPFDPDAWKSKWLP